MCLLGLRHGDLELVSLEQRRLAAEQLLQARGRQALGVVQLPAIHTCVVASEIAGGAEFRPSVL